MKAKRSTRVIIRTRLCSELFVAGAFARLESRASSSCKETHTQRLTLQWIPRIFISIPVSHLLH